MKRSYLLSSTLFLALAHSALAQVDGRVDEPWDPGMRQQAPQGQVTLPLSYSGDGMRVVLQSIDENTGLVSGTISLGQGAAMPFNLRMQTDARGNMLGYGNLRTPRGPQQFQTRDVNETSTQIHLGGRTYTVTHQGTAPAPYRSSSAPSFDNDNGFDNRSTRKRIAPPAQGLDNPLTLTLHTLKDPGMGGMPSHRVLAPRGWTVEGGAWWANPQYCSVLPSRDIRIAAPDGREVHLCPNLMAKDFENLQLVQRPADLTADGGYPVLYLPKSIDEWKQHLATRLIPQSRQGARNIRVTGASVIPEMTMALRRAIEPLRQQFAQQNQANAWMGARSTLDAHGLAFECQYEHGGQSWEELIVIGLVESRYQYELGSFVLWSLEPCITYRAPLGQLDSALPLLSVIANSAQRTRQWDQMRNELAMKLAGIRSRGNIDATRAAAKRSQIMADSFDEVSRMQMETYRSSSASEDRIRQRLVNSIHGVENYRVTGSNEYVQLPDNYRHVYSNGNDEFLLTNNPLFDPNTESGLNTFQWNPMSTMR